MPTIDSKLLIDEIISKNGYYYDDPRVYRIVEYTNAWGNVTYGVTYITEPDKDKYLVTSEFINNPKTIWLAK